MREIKFRGKSHDGEWVYGDLHLMSSHPHIHSSMLTSRPIDISTIGQFTGLHDKNGKEIYEGDIVHLDAWSPYAMQVVFMEGAFCLANKDGEFLGDIHYVHHAGVEQCTILGNIHDDPELLNKEGSNDM